MTEEAKPYNPLSEENLARQVREALEERPMHSLPVDRFMGSGLYAIYYGGPYPAYAPIRETMAPIYVGKSAAKSTRIGSVAPRSARLWKRIDEHATSIAQATNLDLAHFSCRYLVTSDVWIVLGEQGLLTTYGPVWNVAVDGFGNHAPGSGRSKQKISSWDTLHPGRPWVSLLSEANPRTPEQIEEGVRAYFEKRNAGEPVPDQILSADPFDAEESDRTED